jgi:hypothetical protein
VELAYLAAAVATTLPDLAEQFTRSDIELFHQVPDKSKPAQALTGALESNEVHYRRMPLNAS